MHIDARDRHGIDKTFHTGFWARVQQEQREAGGWFKWFIKTKDDLHKLWVQEGVKTKDAVGKVGAEVAANRAKGTRSFGKRINQNVSTLAKGLRGEWLPQVFKNPHMKKLAANPWMRGGVMIGAGLIAFNAVRGAAARMLNPVNSPVIPEYYDKGYDVIKSHMTDFGSPVNIAKAAHKTIRPYYSSVRKGMRTTTQTVMNRNVALAANANAIRHTMY